MTTKAIDLSLVNDVLQNCQIVDIMLEANGLSVSLELYEDIQQAFYTLTLANLDFLQIKVLDEDREPSFVVCSASLKKYYKQESSATYHLLIDGQLSIEAKSIDCSFK